MLVLQSQKHTIVPGSHLAGFPGSLPDRHRGTLCDLIKFISVIWSKCNTPVSTELIQFHFCILLPLYHSMHIL